MKTTIPRVSGFNGEDKRPRFTGNRTASVGVQTGREAAPSGLSPPFPYYGGKSRHVDSQHVTRYGTHRAHD